MADLANYKVGGTIHVIVNNQVGFTTTPDRGRSGTYASDVAKSINAPIFHVNADSMEDVAKTFRFAAEYRQKFMKDVVIDLIGYRKMGHNELDQPAFTQPLMYNIVKQMKPVRDLYREQCLTKYGVEEADLAAVDSLAKSSLEEAYVKSKTLQYESETWETEDWEAIKDSSSYGNDVKNTGEKIDYLRELGLKIVTLPKDQGKFHPQIVKIFDNRVKSIETGKNIDWGTAEALAFASLIDEGYHVRLSGQDVERGTFSHRHAHVFYQSTRLCATRQANATSLPATLIFLSTLSSATSTVTPQPTPTRSRSGRPSLVTLPTVPRS
jgi:2-oxoglutarate dehydrogenase E1 component